MTVLARNAAAADAAATLIANAVTVAHPAIAQAPASTLDIDTDLGERLVTTGVPELPKWAVGKALDAGYREARRMRDAGLIEAAYLALQGAVRTSGVPTHLPLAAAS